MVEDLAGPAHETRTLVTQSLVGGWVAEENANCTLNAQARDIQHRIQPASAKHTYTHLCAAVLIMCATLRFAQRYLRLARPVQTAVADDA